MNLGTLLYALLAGEQSREILIVSVVCVLNDAVYLHCFAHLSYIFG